MPTWQRRTDGKHPAMGCFFHPWVDGSIRGGLSPYCQNTQICTKQLLYANCLFVSIDKLFQTQLTSGEVGSILYGS